MSLFGSDVDWARLMFGENAVHVPVTMTVQLMDSGVVVFVGASRVPAPPAPASPHPLLLGSHEPHVHLLGDAVFRPHWAGEGNFCGSGVNALLTGSAFADPSEWRTILGVPPAVPR